MNFSRRTLIRGGAAGLAVAAVGVGYGVQRWRSTGGLSSVRITGPWPELGNGVQWVLPSLNQAHMQVPDRPHDIEETRDPSRRAAVRRLRDFYVSSSARRLRGDTLAALAPSGTKRFVAIGDSTTFGWGVADDETWPAVLQAELVRQGRSAEVLNAGVPAQRLEGMVAWLTKMGPSMGLDGVLFTRRPYPTGGDPLQAYASAVEQVRRALPRAKVHVFMPPVSQFDPHGSSVWSSESEGLRGRLGGVPLLELTPVMRAAQGTRGCRVEVSAGVAKVIRGETGETLLSAPASQHGLPLEVYALLEKDSSVREVLFFDDGHPDAEGIRALVPAIAAAITDAGWFA